MPCTFTKKNSFLDRNRNNEEKNWSNFCSVQLQFYYDIIGKECIQLDCVSYKIQIFNGTVSIIVSALDSQWYP